MERSPEAPLYSPKVVQELLQRYGLRPTKSFGQNFLIDGNILRLIVETGGAASGTTVYEVGPGLGVLTRALVETGARVTSIEKDEYLREVLAETLNGLDLRLVWGDALTFDWAAAEEGSLLIANLPYYVSTAILSLVMRSGRFARATFLVQREVADRLIAQPNQEAYGFLSALVSLYGQAKIVRNVPKNAFLPAPDVTSAIVCIHLHGRQPEAGLIRLFELALAHRRKTLRNNLVQGGYAGVAIDAALSTLGLSPTIRGEAVSLADMEQLYQLLKGSTANDKA